MNDMIKEIDVLFNELKEKDNDYLLEKNTNEIIDKFSKIIHKEKNKQIQLFFSKKLKEDSIYHNYEKMMNGIVVDASFISALFFASQKILPNEYLYNINDISINFLKTGIYFYGHMGEVYIPITLKSKTRMQKEGLKEYSTTFTNNVNGLKHAIFRIDRNQKKLEYFQNSKSSYLKKELIYNKKTKYRLYTIYSNNIEQNVLFVDIDFYKKNKDRLERENLKINDFNIGLRSLHPDKPIFPLMGENMTLDMIQKLINLNMAI